VVDRVVREVLVDGGDINRGDDRVLGQVQLGVLGGELVVDVKGVHFRLFVWFGFVCNSSTMWIQIYVFRFSVKKDFNFSATPKGLPKNTFPPKYKYFVVQQFLGPLKGPRNTFP
jgi:hypothetical protein